MNEKVREQIIAVRDTGEANMFDVYKVQAIANRMGFYDLVCFIEERKKDYVNFVIRGK